MDHFICKGGCEGVSTKEGVCQSDTCAKAGAPLEPCSCTDGQHFGAFEKKGETSDAGAAGGAQGEKQSV
jgi:hypothetical protein